MEATPHHQYQILSKRPGNILRHLERIGRTVIPDNIWLGVSVEDEAVVRRIDILRRVPCKVRFLSLEPLLGPLDNLDLDGIGWVITGGESGPGARRPDPAWVYSINRQCVVANVAYFHKQWGKPQFNPLAARCPPNENVAAFIKRTDPDPDAKGGAAIRGKLWRQMPDYETCRH
jgi:protein gp37